jgi:putative membrane protein
MFKYDKDNWAGQLFDIRGSMVREIVYRVLACVLWSVVVVLAHQRFSLDIPFTTHTLIGVAIGLLLVFRTNSSYDRFWEGRKQWGCIVNECRNMARTATVYLAGAPDLAANIIHWTIAFAWTTKCRLRGGSGVGSVATWLPADEVEAVLNAEHPPLAASIRISSLIEEGRKRGLISDYVQMTMDQNVQLLIDYMGACERIKNTPMPFAYMVHLRRAVVLYCFTLPLVLVHVYGWVTVPATLLIAYVLYGIEEIAVEIEDPFGVDMNDLPLTRICQTIEENLYAVAEPLPVQTPDPEEIRQQSTEHANPQH